MASLLGGHTCSKASVLTVAGWFGDLPRECSPVSDAARLVKCLWSLFADEIALGGPVFFCFSQETLADPLREYGFNTGSPLEIVCAVARECYEVDGEFAFVKPEALLTGPDGRSMAIVLVCQQVLAVEEMVSEGVRYSENAYFPRLRALMESSLSSLRMNPFEFHEFESIWRTFAAEIIRTAGGTDESITFEFGAYSGVNKARLFPMSQALLSRADLDELLERCQSSRLQGNSTRDAWDEIRRERSHLTRRGQRRINGGFLKERVIEQVQRYVRRVAADGVSRSGQSIQKPITHDLAIALDVVDWFTEEYVAFLVERGGGRRVDAPDLLGPKLDAALTERGYAFFALGDFGDHWRLREDTVTVEPGDVLLLVGSAFGFQKGAALLDGLIPPVAVEEARVRPLTGAPKIQICQAVMPSTLGCGVELRSGRLLRDLTKASHHARYEWIGGICLDVRSHKYLRGFLPKSVRFGKETFAVAALHRVNGIPMSWTNLMKNVETLDTDCSYRLQFAGGYSAELTIGVEKSSGRSQMGFLWQRDGMLSPTLEQIAGIDAAVVGFSQSSSVAVAAPTTGQVACLLRDLSSRAGRPISPEEGGRLTAAVLRSLAPDGVKRLVAGLIEAGAVVSEQTLSQFP